MGERQVAPFGEDGAISFRFVVILAILFSALIFIFQNLAVVEIQFLFWKMAMSRFFLLTGAMLAGVIIGFLLGWEVFGRGKVERSAPPTHIVD